MYACAVAITASLVLAGGPDWLVDPQPYKARIVESTAGEITLDNGLLRRTIKLGPNAATVSFDNLVTGNSLLRSVRPEALVTVDGVAYPVGGLQGQPVHNYLDPAWLAQMKPLPGAYRFDRVEVGVTQERFAWRKRLEWMPADVPWPPPGRSVTLHFRPPAPAPARLAGPVLLEDDFAGPLKPVWKVVVSPAHPRSSFANEGKAGEIMALSDTCVFAEQPLPAGAATVEVTADTGDDTYANSWGPGLSLMAGGKAVASLVMRPNSQQYELFTPALGQTLVQRFDRTRPATLRVRLDAGEVIFEASQNGQAFLALGQSKLEAKPDTLRVGKVGQLGAGRDYPQVKADPATLPPRCHIQRVTVRGPEPAASNEPRGDLPLVQVHYEIYDGIPLLCKWLTLTNPGGKTVRLNTVTTELLAAVEPESAVGRPIGWMDPRPDIYVESDYAMAGDGNPRPANRVVHWEADPLYETQVHYDRSMPCLLRCQAERGPDQDIAPGGSFESFRVWELLLDAGDRERCSLAQRRMYRTIAPWCTENPILMHVRSAEPKAVRLAIDQCAEVGFQMVILTFGSGFDFENRDPKYQQQIKELADYAAAKGVALGGYSLLASRGAGTAADNTQGAPTAFGVMPCLGAKWGADYLAQLRSFIATAGLGVLEHDGSYPGDACAATNHPGHHGLDDSQWVMWRAITDLYKWCCANGVYLNVPDWYVLNGAPKTYMGYRETNWSLPRAYQEIIERQNIYDGTWFKTPSMGWMFVPLTEYHGGGQAATIEPLAEHLDHYETRLASLFGAGVQACYRGPRLYDTDATKAVVKRWVDFYRQHRVILDSDLIHLRRADGRDLDYWLHVNPSAAERGLLMVYNPLTEPVTRKLTVPLYYTGLRGRAKATIGDGQPRAIPLDDQHRAEIDLTVPAKGRVAVVFGAP
ncbi:MAG: hypothetical protein HZB16_13175 [Armatimonadetes bacterium]|nr:hypothetical protein [Armatimonadota bacterium]